MHFLLSLILGLGAWATPLIYLTIRRQKALFCGGSLALCAASLWVQLRLIRRLVELERFHVLRDIIGGICLCASILVGVTVLFNAIVLFEERNT
ncbi:MAG: hypothetical protein IJZ39_00125 [Oscillospiraceae bacterium]|nr:hypothetical protein [Oscillospiraceae bacterium]